MFNLPSLTELLYFVPAVIIALTVHEVAHGFMAYLLGDKTAKRDGRLSLNPLKHIDWLGLLMLIIFRFGWAKPVMVDPRNFKNPKVDMALTAAAGPISNFIFAFILLTVWTALFFSQFNTPAFIFNFLSFCVHFNLVIGVFNMIPIPPLDGSKIFGALLPDKLYFSFIGAGRFSMFLLLILIFTGAVGNILFPLINTIREGMFTLLLNIFG